ncbi:unnamed protein product [Prunus armeniaca]
MPLNFCTALVRHGGGEKYFSGFPTAFGLISWRIVLLVEERSCRVPQGSAGRAVGCRRDVTARWMGAAADC